ncbi:TauD/TfdA dioxygenase family protein [Streptantibioticus ferralitis]|uniref:TauD/TfdA family dioxygenase n=1 Tax=Streptantibioticus ferralitis TaxID=236510 RepID=A0ABT5Z164_9ACTN|nr:TauD/TfdA family dioxygenase [Streptantibioticus ferralitis]MDF2257518.1 TauD/TfdA family dioxygenase [Streptantibioticus ferralitis]
MSLEFAALHENFVVEVTGRTGSLLAGRDGYAIKQTLTTYSVVVIRGLELVPAEQVALTRLLGKPEVVTDMRNHHPESRDILVVSNSGATPVVGNRCWHSDRSFLTEPTRYTMLRADVVPPQGGDTLFADMVEAYAQSPTSWKEALSGAVGVHSYDKIAHLRAEIHRKPIEEGYEKVYPPVRHPVVRAHPETGTPALYLSDLCLTRIESGHGTTIQIPLDKLHAHATEDRFVYRHRWHVGDVVIWDNARVMHKADLRLWKLPRVLHRTTTASPPPRPAATYVPDGTR